MAPFHTKLLFGSADKKKAKAPLQFYCYFSWLPRKVVQLEINNSQVSSSFNAQMNKRLQHPPPNPQAKPSFEGRQRSNLPPPGKALLRFSQSLNEDLFHSNVKRDSF